MAALALSCSGSAPVRGVEPPRSNTGEPAVHAVNSAKLRELMSEIKDVTERADYVGSLNIEQRQAESLQVAAALEKSAAELQARADDLGLNEAARDVFVKLAVKLEKHAKQFGQACQRDDLEQMNAALGAMTATCDACHVLFRDAER